MELPARILDFINQKLELTNYCLPHFYPTSETFDRFQIGYRTDANTGNKITGEGAGDFREAWYVICSGYADDPFFIDISEQQQNYPVYFAWHGAGDWTPLRVADSITAFSDNLHLLKTIEESEADKQVELAKYFDVTEGFWQEVYNEYEVFED